MKASELRLGNWVNNNPRDGVITVFSNDKCVIRHKAGIDRAFIEELEPIPLTEEWLLKFGFKLDIEDDGYSKGKYKVSVSDEGCIFFIYESYYPIEICEFKHIHQLQNLYFALTGEELILNI